MFGYNKHPYLKINILLAGVIMMIFIYSGIFSAGDANHPVPCVYSKIIGEPCPSCGMSRSFSEIVRFNFDKAKEYNTSGIPLFLFFFVQFFQRIIFTLISRKPGKIDVIIKTDIALSILLFIYSFGILYINTWRFLFLNV